jgi:hypothetical protein
LKLKQRIRHSPAFYISWSSLQSYFEKVIPCFHFSDLLFLLVHLFLQQIASSQFDCSRDELQLRSVSCSIFVRIHGHDEWLLH